MAKSYYKIVKGVRYDRALFEAAENRIKGQGDGRISEQDLKELVDLSEDGKGITVTELRTLRYIQDEFNLTEKAQRWLADNVSRLEKEKISSESEDTNSLDKSTFIEEEKEGQAEMANEPHGKVDPNQIDHRVAELNASEDKEETTEKETKSYYVIAFCFFFCSFLLIFRSIQFCYAMVYLIGVNFSMRFIGHFGLPFFLLFYKS